MKADKREVRNIVDAINGAVAAAYLYSPQSTRAAIEQIHAVEFVAEEKDVVEAFKRLLASVADRREAQLIRVFGGSR